MQIFDFIDLKACISIIVIMIIISYHFVQIFKSKEYYRFWSPMSFFSLVFFYYAVYTPIYNISSVGGVYYGGYDLSYGLSYSYVGACLSLCCTFIGFKLSRFKYKKELILPIQENKLLKISIIIFIIGVLAYNVYLPLSFSITLMDSGVTIEDVNGKAGNYLVQCIAFLICACCLFLPNIVNKKKYYLLLFILFAFITYIIGGSRYRIVYLIVSIATMYHLYFQKKIKYLAWIPAVVCVFLFFGVMNFTRSYSNGLDLSKAENVTTADLVKAGQHEGTVFYYSGAVMKQVEDRNAYIYFEPIIRAICQPIPRTWWKDKPGQRYYLYNQEWIFGGNIRAAFMSYAESFFMFGWLGIILNGLFLGWLSKYFWLKFLRNKESLNSILLLSLFNGFIYHIISRGNLSNNFTFFIFYIVIPYFLYKKFYFSKLKN